MTSPLTGYGSLIYPVFMTAALASAAVGVAYAPAIDLLATTVFFLGVASALYYAHARDSYVDYYIRHEDPSPVMSRKGFRKAFAIGLTVWLVSLAFFLLKGDFGTAVFLIFGLLLAYFHTPIDLNPLGATAGYPTGLALALTGGFYTNAHYVSGPIVLLSVATWVFLCGMKVVDDIKDYSWDKKFGKMTVPVILGNKKAKMAGILLVCVGAFMGMTLSVFRILPIATAFSFLPLFAAAYFSSQRNTRESLYGLDALLIGVYSFAALHLIMLALLRL